MRNFFGVGPRLAVALLPRIDMPPGTLESSQDCFACSQGRPKCSKTGRSSKARFVGAHFA
jgi:hypothetical protein